MPVVGFVTRTFASRTFAGPASQGGAGGVGYVLRAADGRSLGMYKDVSAAQAAFRNFFGTNRILKWEQRDLQGDIEQHVAIGLPLDPREIWPGSLLEWAEPDLVPGSVILQNVPAQTIRTINDLSGSGSVLVQSGSPTLISSDPNFAGRGSVNLDRAIPQGFTIPIITALTAPYTVVAVVNNLDVGASGIFIEVDTGGATPLRISNNGAGNWVVSAGAGSIMGPLSGSATDLVVVEVDGTNVSVRINGVVIGSFVGSPSAGSVEIGGITADPWDGRFSFLMIATQVDASGTKVLQTERYARNRYPRG